MIRDARRVEKSPYILSLQYDTAVKGIDKKRFAPDTVVTDQKMTGRARTGKWKPQTLAGNKNIDGGKRDRNTKPAIEHLINIAVIRIEKSLMVTPKSPLTEEEFIGLGQHL